MAEQRLGTQFCLVLKPVRSCKQSIASLTILRKALRNYVDSLISQRFGFNPMPNQKITFSQDAKLNRTTIEEESKTIDVPGSSDYWL